MIRCHRLVGPHVNGGKEPAVGDPVQQRVEVDDRRPAGEHEASGLRHKVELACSEQLSALVGDRRQHEDELAVREGLVQRAGEDVVAAQLPRR